MSFPLVLVSWYDHMTDDEWRSRDEVLKDPPVMQTVGWVVHEDDKVITLAQCIEPPDKDISMQFLILKACVVSKRELA